MNRYWTQWTPRELESLLGIEISYKEINQDVDDCDLNERETRSDQHITKYDIDGLKDKDFFYGYY